MLRPEGTKKRRQVMHLGCGYSRGIVRHGVGRRAQGRMQKWEQASYTGELGYQRDLGHGAPAFLLPTQAPGAAPGEVCAKLELFLWLGLGKQSKACPSELPPDLLPEPSRGLPYSLYRDGEFGARVSPPCSWP